MITIVVFNNGLDATYRTGTESDSSCNVASLELVLS
jgi:hypothetical protein